MQADLTQAVVASGRIITPVRVRIGSMMMGTLATLNARFAARCDRGINLVDGGIVSGAPSGSPYPFHPHRPCLIQGNTEVPALKEDPWVT